MNPIKNRKILAAAVIVQAAIFSIPMAGLLADKPGETRVIASAPETDPNAPDPTLLDEFENYRLTNIPSLAEAQRIYDALPYEDLRREFERKCGDRAYVWSYLMKKQHDVDSGKIFMYFTNNATNPMLWTFHVASYIVVNGQEYVVEKIPDIKVGGGYKLLDTLMFPGPVPIKDWMKRHAGGDCRVLSTKNPDDRQYLMQYNQSGRRIMHPTEKCFIRKTPMTYWWQVAAYNHDIGGRPAIRELSRGTAVQACENSMDINKRGAFDTGVKARRRDACNALIP